MAGGWSAGSLPRNRNAASKIGYKSPANAASFTHYGWSLHDALNMFEGPVVEVHISNPNAREPWRHTSVVSPVAADQRKSNCAQCEEPRTSPRPAANRR